MKPQSKEFWNIGCEKWGPIWEQVRVEEFDCISIQYDDCFHVFPGQGKKKIAFDLVDQMFTREFFLNCSWTGATTDTQNFPQGKLAFKKLLNTIHLFWEVVNNADKTYNESDNKAFLSQIMSRSKQRCEVDSSSSGRKRKMPAGKNRPSGLRYKKLNDDEDEQIKATMRREIWKT